MNGSWMDRTGLNKILISETLFMVKNTRLQSDFGFRNVKLLRNHKEYWPLLFSFVCAIDTSALLKKRITHAS